MSTMTRLITVASTGRLIEISERIMVPLLRWVLRLRSALGRRRSRGDHADRRAVLEFDLPVGYDDVIGRQALDYLHATGRAVADLDLGQGSLAVDYPEDVAVLALWPDR